MHVACSCCPPLLPPPHPICPFLLPLSSQSSRRSPPYEHSCTKSIITHKSIFFSYLPLLFFGGWVRSLGFCNALCYIHKTELKWSFPHVSLTLIVLFVSQLQFSLEPEPVAINCTAFNHNGNLLVTGAADGIIRLFGMSLMSRLIHIFYILDIHYIYLIVSVKP